MKNSWRILSILLLVLSVACLLAPVACFQDVSIPNAEQVAQKAEKSLADAQNKLQGLEGGDAGKIKKQQDKVSKAQAKAKDAAVALEALKSGGSTGDIRYALIQGALPAGIVLDKVRLNEHKVYAAHEEMFQWLGWAVLALILAALSLTLLGGVKPVSRCFTLASLCELLAAVVAAYAVLKLLALPVKAPYSDAAIGWTALPTVLLPILALAVNTRRFKETKRTMIYILCVLLSAISLLPFVIMIVNATRTTEQIQQGLSLIPGPALARNWQILSAKNAFDAAVGFRNSAVIAFGSTLLSVYFSALTAYGLTVYDFKGKKFLFSFIIGIIMIPGQISSIGFYLFMYKINWTDSFFPLIIPAIAAPSTVFFLRQYLQANFQISLVEAARIDGAGEFLTYNRIVAPILMPALATMGIFAVISSWNNYLLPLMMLTDPNKATLPMMVQALRGDIYRTEYGSIYLGLTISALPLLIVYFALSKYIIRGVALGGVKG